MNCLLCSALICMRFGCVAFRDCRADNSVSVRLILLHLRRSVFEGVLAAQQMRVNKNVRKTNVNRSGNATSGDRKTHFMCIFVIWGSRQWDDSIAFAFRGRDFRLISTSLVNSKRLDCKTREAHESSTNCRISIIIKFISFNRKREKRDLISITIDPSVPLCAANRLLHFAEPTF